MRENALIIGAGLGLSASLARLLTKNNFNVAIAARNIEKLENLKIETNSKVFQCDASNIEDVENLFIQSDKLLGAPNLVICLLYTSPSPRDSYGSRMPSSA